MITITSNTYNNGPLRLILIIFGVGYNCIIIYWTLLSLSFLFSVTEWNVLTILITFNTMLGILLLVSVWSILHYRNYIHSSENKDNNICHCRQARMIRVFIMMCIFHATSTLTLRVSAGHMNYNIETGSRFIQTLTNLFCGTDNGTNRGYPVDALLALVLMPVWVMVTFAQFVDMNVSVVAIVLVTVTIPVTAVFRVGPNEIACTTLFFIANIFISLRTFSEIFLRYSALKLEVKQLEQERQFQQEHHEREMRHMVSVQYCCRCFE